MSFRCIACSAAIEARYKSCPECGEPVTDFLREYLGKPVGGNYQLLAKLGRGGMGEVYKARHIYFHNDVVIKVMRPQLTGDTSLTERFIREARVAKKIKHENVSQIYDFSSLPDGSFYMVWEFIDGKNLGQIIQERGALPPEYSMQISVQALRGLEAIHRAGFVHRDISPDNIMITKGDEGRDLVKIIDLGIAKQDTESGETMTGTGLFVGKLKYASPEHLGILSAGERIDGRADLYSFGIVMYEMLAGKAPFIASTPHQYISMQMKEPPPPLPVTPALQLLILRALEKDRNDRFRSASAFAEEIEKTMTGLARGGEQSAVMETEEVRWVPHGGYVAARHPVVPEFSASPLGGTAVVQPVNEPEAVLREDAAPRKTSGGILAAIFAAIVAVAIALLLYFFSEGRGPGTHKSSSHVTLPPSAGTTIEATPSAEANHAESPRQVTADLEALQLASPPSAGATIEATSSVEANPAERTPAAASAAPVKVDTTVAAYNDGATLANAGDIEGAIKKFEDVVAAKPDLLAGWMALAKMQLRTKSYAKAIEAANKVLEVDDSDLSMITVLAAAYAATGDKANAAKYEAKLPKNASALYNDAARLINKGDDAGAQTLLELAIEVDAAFAQSYYELGMIYVRSGKTAQAKSTLQKYLDLDPNGRDAATAKEMMGYLK